MNVKLTLTEKSNLMGKRNENRRMENKAVTVPKSRELENNESLGSDKWGKANPNPFPHFRNNRSTYYFWAGMDKRYN